MASTSLKRSDRFPVGTEVGAYAGFSNRHHEGRPSGTAVESATVDATGTLTFPSLPEGLYMLFALVEGATKVLMLGVSGWTAPGTLKERIAARRTAVGA